MSEKKYFTKEEKKEAKQEWRRRHYQKYKEKIKEKSRKYRAKNKNNEDFKNRNKKSQQRHKENHLEEYKEQRRKRALKSYYENKIKWNEKSKRYFEKNPNYKREWLEKNPKYYNDYIKERSKNDINFKLTYVLRNRLRQALHNNQKSGSAVNDLGCTIPELKLYLESKFQKGMSWKNWGINGWHIDHIKPLSSFDLTNREEFLTACHYTNLQPMWAIDNIRKGSSLKHK